MFWYIPFNCQVTEAFYWRWFCKELFTCITKFCHTNCTKKFDTISLNQITAQRQVANISEDAETELCETFNKCVCHSLTVDESVDSTSTSQTCIFARNITSEFEVFEELADLWCMARKKYQISFRHYYVVIRTIIWNYLSLWA